MAPANSTVDEREPLLRRDSSGDEEACPKSQITTTIARRLYISHFLSTWNSRMFEFGAVLYLASVYPGTLLELSVYALVRGFAAILFAPAIGRFIDVGDRLQVVRLSIIGQRVVVAASCVIFYVLLLRLPVGGANGERGLLAGLIVLACIEKICSILNLVSVEKDWVVVVAREDPGGLIMLNAQMRRIDLICKLIGPLFIALVDGYSTRVAVTVNLGLNVISVFIEYYAIARVYYDVPELQEKKTLQPTIPQENPSSDQAEAMLSRQKRRAQAITTKFIADFGFYLGHRAFLPSFAGALLYLTVLNFAGQMVTFLVNLGFSSTQVGIARTVSVAFEVAATWVAPWLMTRIGPVRAGLWLSSWQVIMLASGMSLFFVFRNKPFLSASALVGGTILSRLGLRGFDLCAQVIVQEDVEAENRGKFSSVEAAWQNAFELIAYATTIVFSRPQQFQWPSLISTIAVASASIAYALFVYIRRGHLLHFCGDLLDRHWTKHGRTTALGRVVPNSEI